ncbi:uncharacterized protein LOC134336569 isoform X1 [Mobula hypostoma]|uniref:uncharacterized protein LOC134336569 isoform X1 n=1 Tax=Mobula hypostoma TaxID=723540 RepID=UPI002FC3D1AB
MEDTSESVAGLNFQQPRRGKGSPGTNSRHHDIEPGDHVVVRTFKRKNCWNLDLKDPFREFWSLIQPSRDQLIELMPAGLASRAADTPAEIRGKTHRGCRGGSQRQGKRTGSRQQRLMEKRSSVSNKIDEFTALARHQRTFWECSIMCFNGMGLHEDIPDQIFSMDGFQTVWADQKCTESGKRKGIGGLLFWLTTDGAIRVILRSRNVFVDRILNFLLLDPGHIPPRYNTGHHGRLFLPVAIELCSSSRGGSDTLSQ